MGKSSRIDVTTAELSPQLMAPSSKTNAAFGRIETLVRTEGRGSRGGLPSLGVGTYHEAQATWRRAATSELEAALGEEPKRSRLTSREAKLNAASIIDFIGTKRPHDDVPMIYLRDDGAVIFDFRSSTGEMGVAVLCDNDGEIGIFVNIGEKPYRSRATSMAQIINRDTDLLRPLGRLGQERRSESWQPYQRSSRATSRSGEGFFRAEILDTREATTAFRSPSSWRLAG